jgi:hypothetical protein
MDFHEPRDLGRTGLKVGRLGVAGGYGAPAAAFEEAFERGCNYFLLGVAEAGPEWPRPLKTSQPGQVGGVGHRHPELRPLPRPDEKFW